MGLLKGTWSFTRFRIAEKLPEEFNDLIDEALKKNAFSNFMGAMAEKTVGWTDLENLLDNDFTYAGYKCGAYIIFALRADRKALPPALLKLKTMEAEKIYLDESGKKRIHRHEHEDIKERVRMELLEKTLAVPSFFDVCWSPSENVVIFGSHAEKVMEEFQKLFRESFGLTLVPLLPWDRTGGHAKGSEDKTSEGPYGGTAGLNKAAGETPEPFKGREFLTWLWFKSEERNGMISIADEEIEVLFLRRLVLAAGDGEYSETVVCQGMHADLTEGKEALRRGKKIREARIMVSLNSDKWEFTLKADMFQFQSLKLPVVMDLEEETDREGRNLERIHLLEKILSLMDRLFSTFIKLHDSPQWETDELPRMAKWLEQ